MDNFFEYSFDFERVDLFHFRSNIHGSDSNDMKLRNRETLRGGIEISVHKFYAGEVCFVDELV